MWGQEARCLAQQWPRLFTNIHLGAAEPTQKDMNPTIHNMNCLGINLKIDVYDYYTENDRRVRGIKEYLNKYSGLGFIIMMGVNSHPKGVKIVSWGG